MLFSVAIPAYKNAFLRECIESILSQTFKDFELIIVNDRSPEPVEETINLFHDERIRYFKNDKNIGALNLVNNWNTCLEKAQGDFFIMMGDDDKMGPDYLEEFCKLFKKYPQLDVYHCRSIIIDENSKPIRMTPSWPEYESVYDSMWHRCFAKRVQFISDFVYRTSVLKNNGGFYFFPLAWFSDDVTAYIASRNKGIAHTNRPVFNYRDNGLSITSTGSGEKKMEAVLLAFKWYESFLSNEPVDDIDRIIYTDLKKRVRGRFQTYKTDTISWAVKYTFFSSILFYYSKRKTYGISVSEIIKAVFLSFKL